MIVSVTERAVYKRCRRQWLINSRNRWGLTKIVSPNALALGTLIHETLGLWLNMHKHYQDTSDESMLLPPGGLANLFLQHAKKAIDKAKETYLKQVGVEIMDGELSSLYEIVQQGQSMMLNYQERWRTPVPEGFEIIATEQRCMVPIPGTEHTSEWLYGAGIQVAYNEPRYHMLEGKLDAILRETRTGRLFVLEHKSYGQRPREDVLFTQDQFLAYHWILLQIAADMGLDPSLVAGVAYDGLWKKAKPPNRVDNRAGNLHDLFCRRLITRPRQELIEFETELAAEVLEMANNPAIYKNRTSDGSCFWGCADNDLCLNMSRGEDYEYTLRSKYTRKEPDEDMDPARGEE